MRFSIAAVAVVGLAALLAPSPASADPVDAGLFGQFNNTLQFLHDDAGATDAQKLAVEAVQAMFAASTASKMSQEITLIEKMLKPLDKVFVGNATYQSAADGLITVIYLKMGALGPTAMLAVADNGLTIVGVSKKVVALSKKFDANGNGVAAEAADYTQNRKKFRKAMLAFSKYCEGIIKRYG